MLTNSSARLVASAAIALVVLAGSAEAADKSSQPAAEGWEPRTIREELRPEFAYFADGGRNNSARWVIAQDQREGLHGFWTKTYAVEGGASYRFAAARRTANVAVPRRSGMVRILWQDEHGKSVPQDEPWTKDYLLDWKSKAEAEHPLDHDTDSQGWTDVSDTYRAPSQARQAVVELHGQWAPGGTIEWSNVRFAPTSPPPARNVRLAAVHYRPKGPTPEANRQQYVPLIEEASRQKADLVVLGETITYVETGLTYPEAAESIPGPRPISLESWRVNTICTSSSA